MGQSNSVYDEETLRRQLSSCRTKRGWRRQGYVHQKSLGGSDRFIRVFGTDPTSEDLVRVLPTDKRPWDSLRALRKGGRRMASTDMQSLA